MAYEDFKYLAQRTVFDKVLRDKSFNIAKIPNYDGYQRGLASLVLLHLQINLLLIIKLTKSASFRLAMQQ